MGNGNEKQPWSSMPWWMY